jgi:hypothetical protein
LRRGHRLAFAAMALAGAVGWMAHGTGLGSMLPSMSGPAFIGVALCGTPLLAWLAWRGGSAARESTARDMLDPYEAAWLSGGARRMTATAIATLAGRGVLLARPAGVVSTSPPIGVNMSVPPDARHPAEQACLSAIADGGLRFGAANMAVEPVAWRCEQLALVGAYALSADERFIGLGKVLGAPSLSGLRDRGAWRSGGKGSTGGSDCSSCGTADVCGSSCGSADAGPGDGCGSSCSGGSSCGGGGGD